MDIYLNNKYICNINNNNNKNVYFNNRNKVLDDIRGYLIKIKGNWNFVGVSQIGALKSGQTMQKMALILESPHKDEYTPNFVPIRPANGRTGRNIQNKICQRTFVNSLSKNTICEVYIINSIQYQCSCHHWLNGQCNRRSITNKVFLALFNNLKADLISRIDNYKPDIVVNACTSPLRDDVVKKAIYEHIKKRVKKQGKPYTYCFDIHPSRW